MRNTREAAERSRLFDPEAAMVRTVRAEQLRLVLWSSRAEMPALLDPNECRCRHVELVPRQPDRQDSETRGAGP